MTDNQQKYSVRKLHPGEYNLWDRFIFTTNSGTIFHSTHWAEIIHTVFGRPFNILAVFKNDEINGGILYWPKNVLKIKSLTNVPVTPYQGILYKTSSLKSSGMIAEYHKITNLLLDELQKTYTYVDIPLSNGITDVRPYLWKNFTVEPSYTYIFNLIEFDQLKNQFSQALRRKINVSLKENLSVVQSDEITLLVKFVVESYKYHKTTPPVAEAALQKLFEIILQQNIGRLFYLNSEDKTIAGIIVLSDQKKVYALFAGIDKKYRNSHFTEYLYADLMQRPEFKGKQFDFLGANTQTFEQFKRSFGGELDVYFNVSYYKNSYVKFLSGIRKRQHILKRSILGKF